MKTHILFLIFWLCATLSFAAVQTANVRIVFPFNPTNVVLHLWGSYSQDFPMSKSGTNEFSVTVPDVNQYMLFNVSYDLPEYNTTNWWIGSGNVYRNEKIPNRFDAHGLKFGMIYINNQLLNNAYTVENGYNTGLNIAVKINDDKTIEPYKMTSNKYLYVNDRIPVEVHHRYPFLDTTLPRPNHIRISGWMQALTDNYIIGDSKIEVDYIRVYGRRGNDSALLVSHEYDSYDPNEDGGLYLRYPFFPAGFDQHTPMPGTVKDGILTFNPSDVRDKVWHWWSHWHNTPTTFDYDSYKMVSRLRITGHAVVQGGIDFRDAAEKTYELGVSDWHFENGGEWQEVVFDTRHFIKSAANSGVMNEVSVEYQLIPHIEGFMLRYANFVAGDYYFNLFDTTGKLLQSERVRIENSGGLMLIKSDYVNQLRVFLYELCNYNGFCLKGKQTL